MTRIFVQRGSSSQSSSSGQNRSSTSVTVLNPSSSSSSSSSSSLPQQQVTSFAHVNPAVKDENFVEEAQEQNIVDDLSECCGILDSESKISRSDDISPGTSDNDQTFDDKRDVDDQKLHGDRDNFMGSGLLAEDVGRLTVLEEEADATAGSSFQMVSGSSPPPPPIPPTKPSPAMLNSRSVTSGDSNTARVGSSRRTAGWPGVSRRSSPTGSHPSSPRYHYDGDGYNSADEQNPCFSTSYDDAEREYQFEFDLRRVKGLEVRKMLEDGNCLFRAVADQVYGDSELYDLVRQMCIDYMERERDHFSQFLTEGFTSYCKRKRRDKVYGNNIEIQALSEMYNRPIHIYSYSTEPINIFHGSYNTDMPPIRLSYHHWHHYNSLVDPRRVTTGAGLGFSSLQGTKNDKDRVKAAIKAQQDQQIENALIAEGRFYSDLELTEKEIERMVMDASRAEYDADDKFKQQLGQRESSTSRAEPSSSASRSTTGGSRQEGTTEFGLPSSVLSNSMQIMLSMGFSYLQMIEASGIFGDDVDSMVCYLIETSGSSRWKGKATE